MRPDLTEDLLSSPRILAMQRKLHRWYDRDGRHDLPWQRPRSAYRVWISEIMLQQTQVMTVIPYFERFMERFPTVEALACAEMDEVLALWSGLGYYQRARNMHRTAQRIMHAHHGMLPETVEVLTSLPGIGPSTAGAIASMGHQRAASILDGNVKRVLARCFAIDGWPGIPAVNRQLWSISKALVPQDALCANHTQALMDLGAGPCRRRQPECEACPWSEFCLAHQQGNTERYPAPRPAKSVPTRHYHLLWLEDSDSAILLEQRPAIGLWPGLWSLPEFDSLENLLDNAILRTAGCSAAPVILPAVRHSFSHFNGIYTPVWIRIEREAMQHTLSALEDVSSKGWYQRSELKKLGLPAPIKKLLTAPPR